MRPRRGGEGGQGGQGGGVRVQQGPPVPRRLRLHPSLPRPGASLYQGEKLDRHGVTVNVARRYR